MMPQVAAAAAVTVSRLVQPAQPLRNIARTIQANNFCLFIRSPSFQLYQAQLQNLLDIGNNVAEKNLRDQENPQLLPCLSVCIKAKHHRSFVPKENRPDTRIDDSRSTSNCIIQRNLSALPLLYAKEKTNKSNPVVSMDRIPPIHTQEAALSAILQLMVGRGWTANKFE